MKSQNSCGALAKLDEWTERYDELVNDQADQGRKGQYRKTNDIHGSGELSLSWQQEDGRVQTAMA